MSNSVDDILIEQVVGGGGVNFAPSVNIPDGLYRATISKVEKVEGPNFVTRQPETQIMFEFTLNDKTYEGVKISKRVTPKWSSGEKQSNLFKIVAAVFGPSINPVGFHLSSMEGKKLRVYTRNYPNKKGTGNYSKIDDFLVEEGTEGKVADRVVEDYERVLNGEKI